MILARSHTYASILHATTTQVSTQYPTHGKGTGVLVDYEGYLCIVAGAHLLPSPVAASKALVYFVLPGMLRSVKVRYWGYLHYCSYCEGVTWGNPKCLCALPRKSGCYSSCEGTFSALFTWDSTVY